MKTFIITMFIFLILGDTLAQSPIDSMARTAYLKTSETLWEKTVESAQQAYNKSKTSDDLFQLVLCQYGLLNATMGRKSEALFDQYIDLIEDNLDELIEQEYREAESKAILSAISGLKIAYAPWKGMILGPKSSHYIDEAIEEGPELPLTRKLMANYLLFTPEMWGGDLNKAIEFYHMAVKSYEMIDATSDWLYLDTLAWLGQALHKKGAHDEAIEIYQKALKQAPDFYWVKEVLLPAAKKAQ